MRVDDDPRLPGGYGYPQAQCAVVPRRARIRGAYTPVSPNLRLKVLLGPVTRVKKKKIILPSGFRVRVGVQELGFRVVTI